MELAYKKQNVFLYKFMPCLLFFIVSLMCLFGSYVYASYDVLYNNENYSLPDLPVEWSNYQYHILLRDSNGFFRCFNTNSPDFYYNDFVGMCGYADFTNNNWGVNAVDEVTSYSLSYIESQGWYGTFDYISSNIDIIDGQGNLVFQAPPQQVEAQGILAEITQGVEMDKTLQEITAILPVILVVIVGLIAIRKAIQFLMARMKRA